MKKEIKEKTLITKCPKCGSRKFTISIFGSICGDCFYEEKAEKVIKEKIVEIIDKWATEWNNDVSSEQPTDQILELISQERLMGVSVWRNHGKKYGYWDYFLAQEKQKGAKKENLITISYHKGEMDFGVNGSVAELSLKELKKLREMIIVAIWCAEDMWRRNQKEEVGIQPKT